MKRGLLLIILMSTGILLCAQNYDSAIGLRLGSGVGASYKQFVRPAAAVEGILEMDILTPNDMKVKVTGLYQFHLNVNIDGLSLYAGPGASAGIYVGDSSGFFMAIDGMAGVEYKFQNSPIVLSFDWNPKIQMIKNAGFKPYNFGLTIRLTL
ncbi:MAG: hypothetical protein Q8R90_05065 [Bacteroidales bacterium]|jgi:hypothetical protein|nr:hypothetical protein [Bacteroidales bacterium]